MFLQTEHGGFQERLADSLAEPGLPATLGNMSFVTPGFRRFRALTLTLLILVVALACTPSAPSLTQGAKLDKDQTLRVLLDDQPASLDPGQTQYPYETSVLRAISEPLLRPNADMNGVSPAAAAGFDVSPNGMIYAFHLRRDAQYWDGTPVKAQDFVFAWQRLIDPRLASPSEGFFADAVLNGDRVSLLDPRRGRVPGSQGDRRLHVPGDAVTSGSRLHVACGAAGGCADFT